MAWGVLVGLLGAVPGVARRAYAQGADSGAFVTRLGRDTLAIERFVRSPDSLWGEMVSRAPRTGRSRYVARLDRSGSVVAYTLTTSDGGHVSETLRNDTATYTIAMTRAGHDTTMRGSVGLNQGGPTTRLIVPLFEPAYGLHEVLIARALAHPGTRVAFGWHFIGDGPDTGSVLMRKDSAWITTPEDTIRLHIDGRGRILSALNAGGTLQATVTRIAWPDLDAQVAALTPLGTLSPRDTVRGTVGGAHVLVDYGRPTKRGRVIFGTVVAFNTIWRTGANAATTFVTDRDLMLGTTPVPAGTYTLFSYVTPTGWLLVVSKKTGEWGTDYDPTADLARIPMTVDRSAAPPVEQFTISLWSDRMEMAWDTWKATVPMKAAATTTGK
jgi:hypothetical protein